MQASLTDFKQYAEVQELGFMQRFNQVRALFWSNYQGEKGLVKAKRGKEFLARLSFYELQLAAANVGFDLTILSSDQLDRRLDLIKDYFSAPLWLFIDMMSRMVANESFDIAKGSRRNWYWDYQMLFHISPKTSIILISDDGDIKDAAVAAGAGDRVWSLDHYSTFLQTPLSQLTESRVVRISVPTGQEVDLQDLARDHDLLPEHVEQLRAQLKDAPAAIAKSKAAVLEIIQPFYQKAVTKWGEDSGKVAEILDVGKFIHYNTHKLALIAVGESPDFILGVGGQKVGLEHTQFFDQAEQHLVGKTQLLLRETERQIRKIAPDLTGFFNVLIDTDKAILNGQSFIQLSGENLRRIARELADYIVSFARGEQAAIPAFLQKILRHDLDKVRLSLMEDFVRRGINTAALVKRIESKEKKIDRYKANSGLAACWLLIVYESGVSSTSFHVGVEDLPTKPTAFDRVFLMDSFTGDIIEGAVQS